MLPADHNYLFSFFCHTNFVEDISIIHNDIVSIPSIPNEKKFWRRIPPSFHETVSDSQANNENTITGLGTEKPQRPWHKSLDKLRR